MPGDPKGGKNPGAHIKLAGEHFSCRFVICIGFVSAARLPSSPTLRVVSTCIINNCLASSQLKGRRRAVQGDTQCSIIEKKTLVNIVCVRSHRITHVTVVSFFIQSDHLCSYIVGSKLHHYISAAVECLHSLPQLLWEMWKMKQDIGWLWQDSFACWREKNGCWVSLEVTCSPSWFCSENAPSILAPLKKWKKRTKEQKNQTKPLIAK